MSEAAEATTDAPANSLLGGDAPAEAPATEGQPPAPPEADAPKEGDATAEGDKPKEDDKPEGPPEAYEFTAPEGYEGELDKDALAALEPVARELGLTNEQANKLVAVQAQHLQAQQKAAQEQHVATVEGWMTDLKNDAEFGGANFDKNAKTAQKAFEAFGSPELKQLLNESGLGSHPELVKAFHRIGQKISEDTIESGSGGAGQRERPIHERMYPNMTQ